MNQLSDAMQIEISVSREELNDELATIYTWLIFENVNNEFWKIHAPDFDITTENESRADALQEMCDTLTDLMFEKYEKLLQAN